MQTAQKLESARIVVPRCAGVPLDEQANLMARAWAHLPPPRPALSVEVVDPETGESALYSFGPHPPRLWRGDIELVDRLWRELVERYPLTAKLHHRDVVSVALRRLDHDLHSLQELEVVREVEIELRIKLP
jgi:hypothetical protein